MKYFSLISAKFFRLAFFFAATFSLAQTTTNSPYSRYGLGEVQGNGFAQNFSLGGTGVGIVNDSIFPYYVNILNPATYVTSRLTVFEAGMNAEFLTLTTSSQKQKRNSVAPGYLAFGIPFTKWWGSSFGLKPYSIMGYNLTDSATLENIGKVNYAYKGSGAINQAFFGNGFRINRYLSVGANVSYLFGSMEYSSSA
jgi:hypothetical protein